MGALLKGGFLFALWIMPIASTAHSQEINIDCEKLGTTLESFLVFKAIDAAGKPISPDHTKGISHNDLRQRASDGHIKRLEPALTEDEVYSCFGNQGRELLFLKNSTDNQRLRFRTTKIWNTFYLFWGQVVLIALGAIATILLAFGNSPRWAIIKNIAIVPTALVTAISSFIAFQDYHGEITRAAKAESDLSKLITEMEIEFLQISTKGGPPPFNVERDKLARWWTRADGIIKGVDDEWLSRFDKIKPVK